jgi:hypothetical protein
MVIHRFETKHIAWGGAAYPEGHGDQGGGSNKRRRGRQQRTRKRGRSRSSLVGVGAEKGGRRGQGREATAVNDTCAFSIVWVAKRGILTASCASVTSLNVHCLACCHIMHYFCPKSILIQFCTGATRNAHQKNWGKIPGGPLGVWDPRTKTKPWFPPHLADIDGTTSLT